MSDRLYCTLAELMADLNINGPTPDEAALMRHVRRASQHIDRWVGQFIPTTETRHYDGSGTEDLFIDPCLAITTLTDDGDAITSTQYLLYPRNRQWENGPYTRVCVDPDATELGVWTAEKDVVAINGRWGKYEETESTGATVANTTKLAAGGTSLLVANGSLISPGMVLLIESEQLVVEATGAPTDSTANTNGALAATDESVVVTDGTKVNAGEIIKIENEQMKVLSISSNTLSVMRGWGGTAKASHTTGQDVYAYRTYTVSRAANGTADSDHLNGTAISRYLPPWDVNWLAVKTAALMHQNAASKFAGKTGNAELGETYYFNVFSSDIKEVRKNYRIVRL
jgi:hypothetical protein